MYLRPGGNQLFPVNPGIPTSEAAELDGASDGCIFVASCCPLSSAFWRRSRCFAPWAREQLLDSVNYVTDKTLRPMAYWIIPSTIVSRRHQSNQDLSARYAHDLATQSTAVIVAVAPICACIPFLQNTHVKGK